MLEIHRLGCGGMIPLPGRYLSSLMIRYGSSAILIDCGEGTQVAIREAGLGFKAIDLICLTHFHADHVAGLPGLLLTIGNTGRTQPLVIVGPKHTADVVSHLCVVAPQLPFEVRCLELDEGGGEVLSMGDLKLLAHPVEHWIACYAYRFDLARRPRFDAARAKELGIPATLWKQLQNGEAVEHDGREFEPSAVLGAPRRGVSLCYATDLRPSAGLARFAAGVDLFVCEGMYGDPAQYDKAVEHRHCLFTEAAEMARDARARELWLTHFSPSLPQPEEFLQVAADIFPNVSVDVARTTLRFSGE